tara:strand:+ start:1127 stop:1366 length:240 start_codon:yes stop_codon:yes gene_type:complete
VGETSIKVIDMGTKKGQTRKTARKAYKPKKRMSLTLRRKKTKAKSSPIWDRYRTKGGRFAKTGKREKAQRFGTTNRTKK